MNAGQDFDSQHRLWVQRGSHEGVSHGDDQEKEEAGTVPGRVDERFEHKQCPCGPSDTSVAIDRGEMPEIDGMAVQVPVVDPCDQLFYHQDGEKPRDEMLDGQESVSV